MATDNLKAVIDAAREVPVQIETKDGRQLVVIPNDFQVKEVGPEHKPPPPYITAARDFDNGDSLAAYVNEYRNKASKFFADIVKRDILVVLDHHAAGAADRCRHIVKLHLPYGEEFAAWDRMAGWSDNAAKKHEQVAFLRFLEENANDVREPEPARLLELVAQFEASKAVEFKAGARLQNGDRQLVYKSETVPKGTIAIPSELHFNFPIYFGEEAVDLKAWFRYSAGEGGLRLGFDWHRIEPIKQAAFRLAATRIAEACGLVPLFGRPA